MKQQELFVELIKSLEKNKKLFLAGKLHSEEEFINNIHKLQKLLPRILNDELRRFVEVFVNSIIKSKNYKIYIEVEKERTIKTQKQEAKRQDNASFINLVSPVSCLVEPIIGLILLI
jgi:hypothetical protein